MAKIINCFVISSRDKPTSAPASFYNRHDCDDHDGGSALDGRRV
jgi:hypothetical protein